MTCHYFDDATHADTGERLAPCPNPVRVAVEPAPEGQFAPALLCLEHVGPHIADHAFHLGEDWHIEPSDDEPDTDATLCETCAHPMVSHTFFANPDGTLGAPAPSCWGVGDGECDCEGFVLYPKA
jgi:hypothetical protein